MAATLIEFPSDAKIIEFDCHAIRPGEITHASQYTTQVQTIFFGREVWKGRLVFGRTGKNKRGLALMAEIDAWVDGLRGVANYTDIPFIKPTLPSDSLVRRSSTNLAGGNLQLTAVGAEAYKRGVYLKFEGDIRPYRIQTISTARVITTIPAVDADAKRGLVVSQVETIRVRRSSSNELPLIRTPDFGGEQLAVDWVEWIN